MISIARTTDEKEMRLPQPSKANVGEAIVQAHQESALYRREADAFAAVNPPQEIAADHAELIREDRLVAAQWALLARFLAHPKGKQPKFPTGPFIQRSFRVLSDLRAKGYNLGPITGN